MKKIVTGLAMLLPLGLAFPALAAQNYHALGVGTTTSNTASTTKPGVHVGPIQHGKKTVFKTVQGTVKAISTDSLTLTVRSKDYTVNATSSPRIVNRVWKVILLSDIRVGDKVRVYGGVTGTTIAAKIIRDISLPVASTTSSH